VTAPVFDRSPRLCVCPTFGLTGAGGGSGIGILLLVVQQDARCGDRESQRKDYQ